MAVTQALLDQLMRLSGEERLQIIEMLLTSLDEPTDSLEAEDHARLHATLARSLTENHAGRVHDAHLVIEELRARHRP